MSTKAKVVPAKKSIATKPAPIKPPKEQPPELSIKVIKSAETTSLTGTGVLGYEIGTDEAGETHYRITANNAGGFFSGEWVSWPAIYGVCNGHTQITSILFRALFKGKSVNTAGFLMAVLQQEGLVQRVPGKTRLYALTEAGRKKAA
ncbi:hypothetical protein E3V39_03560 [Gammaproteobacteria bacterium LSUCC0112]|nr:hypothetical protein E3V39_03560 [Gammaproteobacteria bacterium LSUCC0112]